MSLHKMLGIISLAGLTGLTGLFLCHALWHVGVDVQTVLIALAIPVVPTCEVLRAKLDQIERNETETLEES